MLLVLVLTFLNVDRLKMVKECSILYKNRVIRSPQDGYESHYNISPYNYQHFLGNNDLLPRRILGNSSSYKKWVTIVFQDIIKYIHGCFEFMKNTSDSSRCKCSSIF